MPPHSPPNRFRLPPIIAPLDDVAGPIVVINKSHSGSRLLARMLIDQGVYLGAGLNESLDAEYLVPLVEYLVCEYYPDYSALWRSERDQVLEDLLRYGFDALMKDMTARHTRWGWKLGETTYILPVIQALFPDARVIHIIRDGRDVAFSDHVAPHDAFWKKVYFNSCDISRWRGRRLSWRAYRRASHLYNAQHWVNSVTVGRAYGSMLGERYREVRYEDLCRDYVKVSEELLRWLGLDADHPALREQAQSIHTRRIGRFHAQPWYKRRQVLAVAGPALKSMGYN